MRIGTKTVLFGFHCFWIHPFYVALAWWKLYGFPLDPRLWGCFLLHDIGYLGKVNIDGPEGETHPLLGAKIMEIFGRHWRNLCLYHSRAYAQRDGVEISDLGRADKLAIVLTPKWLMKTQMTLSGELDEAFRHTTSPESKFYDPEQSAPTFETFHEKMCERIQLWLKEHQAAGYATNPKSI